MRKLSITQMATGFAKKTVKVAGKAARTGAKQAVRAGKKVMSIEVPDSLNWIFGFGFKVGIFLILKSFLILRDQITNLQLSGFIIIITQLVQALALIACGALMQNKNLYDDPLKLRKISQYYGYAMLFGALVFGMRSLFGWQFFKEPAAVNWFVDFFTGISKGASELGLGMLFWDFDLWSLLCAVLYFITTTYLHVSFDYDDGLWAMIFDKYHALQQKYNLWEPQTTIEGHRSDDQ